MSSSEHVTIVFGKAGERVSVELVTVEPLTLVVRRGAELLRFSRVTGFEQRGGGSWSAWRLAGKDHRRFKVEREGSGSE